MNAAAKLTLRRSQHRLRAMREMDQQLGRIADRMMRLVPNAFRTMPNRPRADQAMISGAILLMAGGSRVANVH